MKKCTFLKTLILSVLAVEALMLCPVAAKAQLYGTQYLLNNSTNNPSTNQISGVSTFVFSTNFTAIDCTKYNDIALSVGANGIGTNGTVAKFSFKQSLDGTTNTSETTDSWVVNVTLNGTTPVVVTTNIHLLAPGYLIFDSVQNVGAVSITNLITAYALKPLARGY